MNEKKYKAPFYLSDCPAYEIYNLPELFSVIAGEQAKNVVDREHGCHRKWIYLSS